MDEARAFSPAPSLSVIQDRLGPTLTFLYQAVALLAFAILPVLAYGWLQTPFIGAFFENTLVVNRVQPSIPGAWEGLNSGLRYGDQLVEINGQSVASAQEVQDILRGFEVGDQVSLALQVGTEQREEDVTLQVFPNADRLAYLYIPYLIGLIYLGTSLWVFSLRRADIAGRTFAVFATSMALGLGGLFDVYMTHRLNYLWTFALAIAGASLIQLAFVFPRERGLTERIPYLIWVGYLPGIFLLVNAWPNLFNLARPHLYDTAWRVQLGFAGFAMLFFIASAVARRFTSPSPIEREQTRVILWSALLSFGPFTAWALGGIFGVHFMGTLPATYIFLPFAIFPLAVAYAILRYRLLNTDYILSRAVLYAMLTLLAGAGYALLVSGASFIFGSFVQADNPYLIGTMVFVLALVFNPLRLRLQKVVDALFFRGEGVYRQQLQTFSSELTQIVEMTDIVGLLRRHVNQTLLPLRTHIFIHNQLTDQYTAAEGESGYPTTDIRFTSLSGVAQMLKRRQTSIFINETEAFPGELRADKARLALLGAQLFIALPGQQRLAGWLALGPRRSGEAYTNQDLTYLTALCEQAALAIERAQVVADKDQRVREMNVLTRVAQGVNVTLDFNDILELIYAQTSQVLPANDFNVTLYTPQTRALRHAFYVESDERLPDKENRLIPAGEGLEREVVESRRSIITDDYARECRGRRAVPVKEGVYAWMGVALNAGAETIGVIGIASRSPAVVYSEDQHSILQAIADQAAGAIVKARLLQESEQRTRQLATLNEVARNLTSTLEIDPLLNGILRSAVEILNCEAGSLLLLDEDTGELVFEVAVGPVAEDLIGKRLSPGVGLVGKAVNGREPVMVNNVEQSAEWYDQPDRQTGFRTQRLLVVPMMVKERVIGVIEVINKKDGLPFDSDDQELLTAFTGQAAIAVENARLYTLTDQRLASRVEELSVMQRIDRELNASLDVRRAMRITLEWALRQSRASAGLVGVVEDEGLWIMASEGYGNQLKGFEVESMPLKLPTLEQAVMTGQVQRVHSADARNGDFLLAGARSQVVIPIRREVEVVGLLLLESAGAEPYSDETQAFLARLSDHAAIAISNASLYAEVQRANLAKSDFVSFVSHELKTPMTSIKGYSDLLAAGAVGQINEAQSEFLTTIRNNINRMATLVSDLADVSRIEAGRLKLEFQPVSVQEVVDEVLRTGRGLIEEKQQTLSLLIPANLPKVWGDRNRIIQVLTNLYSNASKYTPPGGAITIRAEQGPNQWDLDGAPRVVHLAVQDTGIGIKFSDQTSIFQQYFRTEEGKETAPGTGLGLNIARTLVEMQGGKIWFESEPQRGTTFHFTIPVSEVGVA